MQLLAILGSSFLIGFSGAAMPGPMLGVVIDYSLKKGWKSGPITVFGHAILELILVFLMVVGLKDFFANPIVAAVIAFFGGFFLLWMGYGMLKSVYNKDSLSNGMGAEQKKERGLSVKSPALAGALVSITNPYWIIWWASTGMESVRQAYVLGIYGVLLFFIGHISSDFVWYTAVSTAVSKGKNVLNDKAYRWIIFILALFLIVFSIYYLVSGGIMLYKLKY